MEIKVPSKTVLCGIPDEVWTFLVKFWGYPDGDLKGASISTKEVKKGLNILEQAIRRPGSGPFNPSRNRRW